MTTKELKIEGMSCGHCVMSVKKELSNVPDVSVQDVQIGSARVQVDEATVTDEQLTKAIEDAGYRLVKANS